MLTDSQKEAQAIKNRMYQLLEVADQINFGQAVTIASWASAQTGVRAAFLLSILTQESNLGKNVGTCNRAGDPPKKSWKVVMNPTRDQPKFVIITSELGRNPDITPISCPMSDKRGNRVGWGGAMGPAQFIPSTWMGYRDKVTAVTGKAADPWDIRDAFLASAIKLAADGGTSKSGEWAAAMRYFSGGTNPAYSFYGDSVVARADSYQSDIDKLNK
jgi:membrane-bound lytic murein transglycosylase B